MARNQKLTAVIGGRAVSALDARGPMVSVHFGDGSLMTIQTDGTPPTGAPAPGARVKAVRQQGTRFLLDLDDGSSLELHTAEATSSVLVRDGAQRFEYAD